MGKRVLWVLTKDARPTSRLIGKVNAAQPEAISLCAVDYSASRHVDQFKAAIQNQCGIAVEIVDFSKRFNEEAFRLKEDYMQFIRDLAEKPFSEKESLKTYFRYPSEDFSVWWFSLIAEKNPFKSDAFTSFVRILTLLRLKNEKRCGEIWLPSDGGTVWGVLRQLGADEVKLVSGCRRNIFWLSLSGVMGIEILRVVRFVFSLWRKIYDCKRLSKHHGSFARVNQDYDLALVTMFPYIDEPALETGRFVNVAYGSLQPAIEANHGKKPLWLAMYAPVKSYGWAETVQLAGKVKKIAPLFLVEEWLSYRDLFKILRNFFLLASRCVLALGRCRTHFLFRDRVTQIELNLWEILKRDFVSSFFGKLLIWGITHYATFSKVVKDLACGTKVFHFAELHGWEKALNLACSKRKDITCIGMQHTQMPLLLLNYFEHPAEVNGGGDYLKYSPRPDYIGCVGPLPRELFLKSGWPREKIFILGGFRFRGLEKPVEQKEARQRRGRVVVAFSWAPSSTEFLRFVYDAFYGRKLDYDILLRGHPFEPLDKLSARLGLQITGEPFKFTNEPLDKLIGECRAMIAKESSSILWAIRGNLPVIVPHLHSMVDLCLLSGTSDLATYVDSPENLFGAVQSLVSDDLSDQSRIRGERSQDFFHRYMEIYEDENRYYRNLKNCVSI